jgi:hypothetical protein
VTRIFNTVALHYAAVEAFFVIVGFSVWPDVTVELQHEVRLAIVERRRVEKGSSRAASNPE